MTEELRRTPRARLDVAVEITLKGDGTRHHGQSRDISLGGMFIEASITPAFGTEVMVELTMPREKAPFSMPGVVRWTRDGGMGVQFGLLGARETHAISEFVAKSSIRLSR